MKFRMDKILRFWVDVAAEHIKSDQSQFHQTSARGANPASNTNDADDAMRYLNAQGKIAWKASPRFLTMLADAERDARDDLADLP